MRLYLAYARDWWRRVRDMLRRRRRWGPRCPAPGLAAVEPTNAEPDQPADPIPAPIPALVASPVLDTLPFWEVATYVSACLVHPLGPPFPTPARQVIWRWAAVVGLVAMVVLPAGCGGEDFDPDTDPKNPNCGETSEECG